MKVTEIHGVKVPAGMNLNVWGWQWPEEAGERPSKVVFELLVRAKKHVQGPEAGIGAYRSRLWDNDTGEVVGPWFVWVVDVNVGIEQQLTQLKAVQARRVEPTEEIILQLVMRHLRSHEEGIGTRRRHFGLGAFLDELGNAHIRVGHG